MEKSHLIRTTSNSDAELARGKRRETREGMMQEQQEESWKRGRKACLLYIFRLSPLSLFMADGPCPSPSFTETGGEG